MRDVAAPRSGACAREPSRLPRPARPLPLRLLFLLLLPVLLDPRPSASSPPSAAVATHPARTAPESGPGLVATRIDAARFPTHHVGGPDADAGIDDWFLSNGTLCAAVSDPAHESALSPRGGVLIDLGHCGADDDQWAVLQPMLNLSQSHVVPISEITAGRDEARAWLRTRAEFVGVEIETTYALGLDEPEVLTVSTRARRRAPGDRLFSIGRILLHPSSQTPVFSLLRSAPERSVGFVYPESDRRSVSSLLGALINADVTILVGGDALPPISYGVERRAIRLRQGATSSELASFSVSGAHFTFVNAFTRPLWLGAPDEPIGWLQLLQLPFMDLPVDGPADPPSDPKEQSAGEGVIESELRIHVGDRADVASITDRLWPEAPLVSGRVDDPDARIHVDLRSGAPFTERRPDPDGRFRLRLPPGAYRARVVAPGERSRLVDFEVAPEPRRQTLDPIVLDAPAWVRLPEGFVGRLVFLDLERGGPAVFGSDLLGLRIGEERSGGALEAPWLSLAGTPGEPERVPLAPGHYRVVATRGPEYAAAEVELLATAGEETALALAPLVRVAPTPGWLAADLHVHTGESFDSALPPAQQVAAFVASGAEVLVATEHDRIVDPRPAIAASGLEGRLASITGVEVTSSYEGGDSPFSTGHLNAFPTRPVPGAYRAGAPALEGRRLRDALVDIRALEPGPFVQLNHPRPDESEAEGDTYFQHLGVAGEPYDPTRPLDARPNAVLAEPSPEHGGRDLDFDGIELMNAPSLLRYRRVRADWLSLALQGRVLVGTANSDSHRLGRIVGLPRTYVAIGDDRVEAFDETAFVAALRAGRAWGTTGPLLRVRLDEAGLGDLHRGAQGTLRVWVDAAPWVPVEEWRAYVDGELVHRAPIAPGASAALPLVFARDALVTVEVEGPASGLYADALPGFRPFAFTNPIFVDADASGRYDPPGLVPPLPRALRDPDRPD